MRWHDFDRNGRIDGRDYYIMNELFKEEEKQRERENASIFDEDGSSEDGEDDLW